VNDFVVVVFKTNSKIELEERENRCHTQGSGEPTHTFLPAPGVIRRKCIYMSVCHACEGTKRVCTLGKISKRIDREICRDFAWHSTDHEPISILVHMVHNAIKHGID